MEFQIGQVWVRVVISVFERKVAIKAIYPVGGDDMEYTEITIRDDEGNPIDVVTTEYKRGDKDAEKSAIS